MKKLPQIIVISFLILFLELLLIRLVGTEIRIFAYFSNLLLLGIFVGSGVGMFIKRKIPLSFSAGLLALTTAIVVFGWMDKTTELLAPISESFFWFQINEDVFGGVIFGLFFTFVLFFLVSAIFVPLGQKLGELLEDTGQLIALYTINVLASIAGMWVFQAFSIWRISLFAGIALCQLMLVFVAENQKHKKIIFALFIFTFLIVCQNYAQNTDPTVWSPYQKLTMKKLPENPLQKQGYMLQVNNVGYMGLLDLSDDYKNKLEEGLDKSKLPQGFDFRFSDQYTLPFVFKPSSNDVLIVGAGGGNDVAAAVKSGAKNIDAVEIDPEIIEFGKRYHPEKPYSSSAVNIFNDDGRSFFRKTEKTEKKYDIVIMGLADSHTLTSSLANVRLDHYLYTRQSFEEVRNILKPDGLLFVTFDVRRDWIGSRIQKSLSDAFGHDPLVFSMQDNSYFGWGGVVFVSSRDPQTLSSVISKNDDFNNFLSSRKQQFSNNINPLTDDWPYLYLDHPRLPQIHLWISLFLIIFIVALRPVVSWQGKFYWVSFFLAPDFCCMNFKTSAKRRSFLEIPGKQTFLPSPLFWFSSYWLILFIPKNLCLPKYIILA